MFFIPRSEVIFNTLIVISKTNWNKALATWNLEKWLCHCGCWKKYQLWGNKNTSCTTGNRIRYPLSISKRQRQPLYLFLNVKSTSTNKLLMMRCHTTIFFIGDHNNMNITSILANISITHTIIQPTGASGMLIFTLVTFLK